VPELAVPIIASMIEGCIVVMGVKANSRGRGYQIISQKFVSVTSK
jgi:hypothetical protein